MSHVGDTGTVSQFPDGTGWTVRGTVEKVSGETLHVRVGETLHIGTGETLYVRTDAGELLQCGHNYFRADGDS